MNTAIVLFFASLVGICGMLAWKAFEIKVKRIHFISNLFRKGDEIVHNFENKLELKYKRYEMIANLFVFDFVPAYAYEKLVKMKDYVAKKYYMTGEGFRGRRVLRSDGSVSFFLEQLSDEKVK